MIEITKSLSAMAEYEQLKGKIQSQTYPVLVTGLSPIHKAHFAAALHQDLKRPVCVLTNDESAATRFSADVSAFAEKEALQMPARDLVFVNVASVSRSYEHKRLDVMLRMRKSGLFVLSASAALQRTIPPALLAQSTIALEVGSKAQPEDLTQKLIQSGYERSVQVEGIGQFAWRGDIVDIYPPGAEHPYRIEFWDEEIDGIWFFDSNNQRRLDTASHIVCLPCTETLPALADGGIKGLCTRIEALKKSRKKKHTKMIQTIDRDLESLRETGHLACMDKYLPLAYPEYATALHHLPKETIIIIEDTPRFREAVDLLQRRIGEDIAALMEIGEFSPELTGFSLGFSDFCNAYPQILRFDTFLNQIPMLAPKALLNVTANQMNAYGGNLDMAAADINTYLQEKKAICVVCGSDMRAQHMMEALTHANITARTDDRLPNPGQVHVVQGLLSTGFEYPSLSLVVLTEGQVLARRKKSKTRKSNRDHVKSYTDLTPGDLVVHEHHGIGRFVGMQRMDVDGSARDFVKIAFAGTDFLYVPATSLDLISKYIGGGEEERVRLNKLGGTDWTRARAKAKAAAKELAEGLIKLYAARAKERGFAFPEDDAWQKEFEDSFPYEETDDQLQCIREIKVDMQSDRPMDRLLCGDVGFGKTEVALRAVMKCIMAGKQAAILVPTTVLARQHYLTTVARFQGNPLSIELLTRHKTASEQKLILQKTLAGSIDIIIGTHKLFRKDLRFHNLGLLVIDEEQRFGVSHKEKLKEMSKQVDVLTLSATPIPRTLNMALSGIRDMSTIEEPPKGRFPVQTYVLEHNDGILFDAMRRELSRGGQIFYLHNHVDSIARCANFIQSKLPDAGIGVVHGRMAQKEINTVMTAMAEGEIDILVCTTIIETGIDIPNANTLIIENADFMGLAQLHQIRGRVGRSSRHAYAYLTYRHGKTLSEIAQKRLSAIREYAAFGSGFKIAMRDLEIRGAGNVLGPEQSGHMMSVGYDLYLKILEEAVMEEKGEIPKQRVECAAELLVSANLPERYVPDAGQRVDLYRRIALIRNEEQRMDLLDELIDRFGEPPTEAISLLDIALLRSSASEQGISEIKQTDSRLQISFAAPDFARISALCAVKEYRGRLLLNAGTTPYVSLRLNKGEDAMGMAVALVTQYAMVLEQTE